MFGHGHDSDDEVREGEDRQSAREDSPEIGSQDSVTAPDQSKPSSPDPAFYDDQGNLTGSGAHQAEVIATQKRQMTEQNLAAARTAPRDPDGVQRTAGIDPGLPAAEDPASVPGEEYQDQSSAGDRAGWQAQERASEDVAAGREEDDEDGAGGEG
jgi:hypothetical protein